MATVLNNQLVLSTRTSHNSTFTVGLEIFYFWDYIVNITLQLLFSLKGGW